jgi:methyl-accepting chemotaxis protein
MVSRTGASRSRTRSGACCIVGVLVAGLGAACGNGAGLVLTEQVEARGRAADLRVQFRHAADAANQAVMADTDETSAAAAAEARRARQTVDEDVRALKSILEKLAYTGEIAILDEFRKRLAEYEALDDTILDLAVENTNLKAQRLSFGPAREASDAFRASLKTVAREAAPKDGSRVEALIAQAEAAVLEIQVLDARHNAESGEAAMSAMEAQMATAAALARSRVAALKELVPRASGPALAAAASALDRFNTVHSEILELSRRNTNVRALPLTLGRKRMLTAGCEELLQQLAEALTTHEFKATK